MYVQNSRDNYPVWLAIKPTNSTKVTVGMKIKALDRNFFSEVKQWTLKIWETQSPNIAEIGHVDENRGIGELSEIRKPYMKGI